MSLLVQQEIIRLFVQPSKQERLLWELNSKKRRDIIWKFHNAALFSEKCLIATEPLSPANLRNCLCKYGSVNSAFFWSESIAEEMPIDQACLQTTAGGIYILYCGNGVGYYQGEEGEGTSAPPRYILCNRPNYN